ncbi:S41 family peptidase [Algicola sagamiensis]|uniref:S41 family peptidase n=1 Tax=Algicola sagamiensis TaxID=163869 RepID=UPI00036428AF|nr:S41 family peptidase [Algicola sagamiensis]
MKHALFAIPAFFLTSQGVIAEEARILRFPDIHQNRVTFVHAGDIYLADVASGMATRLTAHKGQELFPKFSPDGKKIAFSAEYSGNRQVYVMNRDGSDLKQLTYYNDVGVMPPRGGFDYRVLDWAPDGKNILVKANRVPYSKRMGQPYLVPVDGGMEKPLPVFKTGGGMLSPDGNKYIYTPEDRDFRTWKRYRGGHAQDVWIYDLENHTSQQITKHKATDQQPLWVHDSIFFVSDRNFHFNLFQYNASGEPKQVTHHETYDVLWPSAGPDAIVYENGGYLYRFDPKKQQSQKLSIQISGLPEQTLPGFKKAFSYIDSASISHDGKRVTFSARGDVFTVPANEGEVRNLSNSSGVREMNVTWSPDGKYIAYLSDKSGEYELYIQDQAGEKPAQRITFDGRTWRFQPFWSPNSQKLAFTDAENKLWVVDIDSKKPKLIDQSPYEKIHEVQWSPDSQHLVYPKEGENGYHALWLYHLKDQTFSQVTSGMTQDSNPVFDPKGDYLYFISLRDFNLSFSQFEFNYLYREGLGVYGITLRKDIPHPGAPKSDEVEIISNKGKKEKEKEEKKPLKIDIANMEQRIFKVDLPPADYQKLAANDQGLFVLNEETLSFIDIRAQKKAEVIQKQVDDFQLSANGKKLLVRKDKKYAVIDAKPKQKFSKHKLNLKDMVTKVDPKAEWHQIFQDGWRVLRDWFYDPNMHGVDWDGIYKRYEPMARAANSRADLDYVLSEVAGEIHAGHTYVNAGEYPKVKRRETGLLGAEINTHASGYFQIGKIYPGENWDPKRRSPLTEPGINIREGEFILAVNRQPATSVKNFYQLMENTAGKTIELKVNDKPEIKGSRTVMVRPIKSEQSLRYLDWVASRKAMVDKLSGGKIGYVHLPNTLFAGNKELAKTYLPQLHKPALIIDDRYNGGGFIPDRMMEILSRKTMNYWKSKGLNARRNPGFAHDGPKAMLINGEAGSGGDALPYYFRENGLGKLIGTTTWGGLIGISSSPFFVDGGQMIPPVFRFIDKKGRWLIENEGVNPDIEVQERADLIAKGHDPVLERAVKELLKALEKNPKKTIKAPLPPTEFQ